MTAGLDEQVPAPRLSRPVPDPDRGQIKRYLEAVGASQVRAVPGTLYYSCLPGDKLNILKARPSLGSPCQSRLAQGSDARAVSGRYSGGVDLGW